MRDTYADNFLVADSGAELQAMLDVVEAYMSGCKIKFNSRKKQGHGSGEEGSRSELEDGEVIVQEVEEFKYL